MDLAMATDPEVDPAEAARVGAMDRANLVLVLEAEELARRERTLEWVAKFLRVGRDLVALVHREVTRASGRLARPEADLWKAGPSKWVRVQVARAAALARVPEWKAAHGILWEGAVAARRSIRMRVAFGFSVKVRLRLVPAEQAQAAREAELA